MINKLDLKYTFRQLSKKPGFVLLAILVLAVGLGISLMAFTISYSMTYKTLPITNGERIYHICTRTKKTNCGPFNAFEFAQIRPSITTFENIGVYTIRNNVPIGYEDTNTTREIIYTEPELFGLSNTNALVGRTLQPLDYEAGAELVIVVGYDFWQQYLERAEDVVGQYLTVAGEPARIVGVMPLEYKMPWANQLWMPLPQGFLEPTIQSLLPINTFALLKDDVAPEQADAEIANLVAGLREQYPYEPARLWPENPLSKYSGINVFGIDQVSTGHVNVFPLSEFGSIGSVLVIFLINILTMLIFLLACINVGTLLLARTNERLRDISVRVALGAPRRRLFLQTLGENIVIVILGSLLALLFAGFGLELINLIFSSIGDGILAFWMQFHLDGATLVGVLLFSVLTIILTGAIPVWRIVNGDFNAVMRDGTRGALGLKTGRFNRALVVTSISIVTVLMAIIAIAGSLIYPEIKSWSEVPDNVLFAGFSLDAERYDAEQQQQFLRTLGDTLVAEPGVAYISIGAGLGTAEVRPETGDKANVEYAVTARITVSAYNSPPPTDGSFIAPDAPVFVEGRNLNEFDQADTAPVALISRQLATALWPGESALNKRVRVRGRSAAADSWREVVGVYDPSREVSSLLNSRPEHLLLPFSQVNTDNLALNATINARSEEQLEALKTASRTIFNRLDSGLQVQFSEFGEMRDALKRSADIGINLAMTMGLFTFLVAITGIYGLTQNAVQMATQEIGTRRALGATDKSVALTFIRKGSRQLVTGFLIALLVAAPFLFILNQVISSLEMSIRLPMVVTGLVLIMLYGTILAAIFVPVRRLLRMEPAEALHHE